MPETRPCQFIQTQAGLDALVDGLRREGELALDTESNSFHAYYEKVCLIQVSTRREDWAIDPLAVDVRSLGPILADPAVEVVIHAADYDIRTLKRDFGFTFSHLFDTMLAAKVLGRPQIGLAALVQAHFGVRLAKVHQRSDWGRRPLSADQVAYAYGDTRHLLPLRDLLRQELEAQGRWAEAQAAFEHQAACEPRPKVFDVRDVERLRGYRQLDEAGRRVARALFLLREECARAADRPPFKIFGNEQVIELARKSPRSAGDLAQVKGLGGSMLRRSGDAILAAIAKARESTAA